MECFSEGFIMHRLMMGSPLRATGVPDRAAVTRRRKEIVVLRGACATCRDDKATKLRRQQPAKAFDPKSRFDLKFRWQTWITNLDHCQRPGFPPRFL